MREKRGCGSSGSAQRPGRPPPAGGWRPWGGRQVRVLLAAAACAGSAAATTHGAVPEPQIPWSPRVYVCRAASAAPQIDGRLAAGEWGDAEWTEAFVEIRGPTAPRPRHRTRVKMLWDAEAFYVAAQLEEPHLWATLTRRDAVIYQDNDFEVFIDPDGDSHEYYELEINTLGTEWDLLLVRPYRDGGPAVHAWDIPGLRTAVDLQGTLNDPADRDEGWSVEIAFPWEALRECAHTAVPPRGGDRWRVNFSRVQWSLDVVSGSYRKATDPATGDPLPEANWVWSPQGLINMHYPEMWGIVEFVNAPRAIGREPTGPGAPGTDGVRATTEEERVAWLLRRIYYRQRNLRARTGNYTADWSVLALAQPRGWAAAWPPRLARTAHGFVSWVTTGEGRGIAIRTDGRVWRYEPWGDSAARDR
ncbi:MAG: carbohydrate-binding family 9-like protein [Candidatus Eisenbacteria bacterium]|nr:carbohydrate-binding family 9-like protein [Candidatus Eisenbacteria bacterium]